MSIVENINKIRTPQTSLPVLECIKRRFSPRVYSAEPIPEADLEIIFEAARLAPSARNRQPWFFYVARQDTAEYEKLFTCIPDINQWAKTAPVIILACSDPTEPIETTNRWALYDLGAAVMSLVLQATELNYACRQIGIFDREKTKQSFSIPNPLSPYLLIAIGKMGTEEDYRRADPELIKKELDPKPRKAKIYEDLKT